MAARVNAVQALKGIAQDIAALPDVSRASAALSLNSTVERKGLPSIRRDMAAEVNFPAGYLNDKSRLGITKRATKADLQVAITARFRPTSLARFAQGQAFDTPKRRGYVSVRVSGSGGVKRIKRAFFVRLRRGRDTSDGFNLGLAIRLKAGEQLGGRRLGGSGVQISPNLYLLYGPSVDQVFKDAGSPAIVKVLPDFEREYRRQFVRLSRAR